MNKNYKLFVTDMDGTLLNDKHNITKENFEALSSLRKKGTEVMIATGRVDTMVKAYVKQLGLTTPVISCNGGLIRNILTKETLYIKEIIKASVRKTIDICKKYGVPHLVYGEHHVYADEMSPRVQFIQEYNETQSEEDQIPFLLVDDIYEILDKDEKLIKVLIISADDQLRKQIEGELSEIQGITAYPSAKILLDVMSENVSKGNALKRYAEIKGLQPCEIAAIGDNFNDISMLDFAGFSVAMENAEKMVQSKADYITKDNNHHGVSHAIKRHLL